MCDENWDAMSDVTEIKWYRKKYIHVMEQEASLQVEGVIVVQRDTGGCAHLYLTSMFLGHV